MPSQTFAKTLGALCLLALFAAPVLAGEASPKSLKALTGIWAKSAQDCKAELSGALERVDRATATSYELVGICHDGLELMYQPVDCFANKVTKTPAGVELTASCRTKNYPRTLLRIGIKVTGQNQISFSGDDFDKNYFYISGDYVRCNRTFTCEHL